MKTLAKLLASTAIIATLAVAPARAQAVSGIVTAYSNYPGWGHGIYVVGSGSPGWYWYVYAWQTPGETTSGDILAAGLHGCNVSLISNGWYLTGSGSNIYIEPQC